MSVEDRVIALIDEGNSIPDPNDLDRDRLDAAAYFATLEQRSSKVTQFDTKTPDNREKNKKNVMAFLVAAAVVIVAGIGFMVLTQDDEVLAAEDFVGIWVSNTSDFIAQFNEDGTYAIALAEQQLAGNPVETGEWGLEGTEFTFNIDFSLNDECQATRETPGRYEVELLVDPAGAVKWTVIDDPCQLRIEALQSGPGLRK